MTARIEMDMLMDANDALRAERDRYRRFVERVASAGPEWLRAEAQALLRPGFELDRAPRQAVLLRMSVLLEPLGREVRL
jgi:hypothetical protein